MISQKIEKKTDNVTNTQLENRKSSECDVSIHFLLQVGTYIHPHIDTDTLLYINIQYTHTHIHTIMHTNVRVVNRK